MNESGREFQNGKTPTDRNPVGKMRERRPLLCGTLRRSDYSAVCSDRINSSNWLYIKAEWVHNRD